MLPRIAHIQQYASSLSSRLSALIAPSTHIGSSVKPRWWRTSKSISGATDDLYMFNFPDTNTIMLCTRTRSELQRHKHTPNFETAASLRKDLHVPPLLSNSEPSRDSRERAKPLRPSSIFASFKRPSTSQAAHNTPWHHTPHSSLQTPYRLPTFFGRLTLRSHGAVSLTQTRTQLPRVVPMECVSSRSCPRMPEW